MAEQEKQLSWERLPGESSKAFDAFRVYRDMGPDRTMPRAVAILGRPVGYIRGMEDWSRQYHWTDRCKRYDDYLERKMRIAAEQRIPEWEAKRQTSLDQNLLDGSIIRSRLREMMAHPLTREVKKESDGKTTIIVEPAGWNWNTIVQGVKMVAELEAATIAEGLMEADDEDFDPETAPREKLVEFIAKYRKRKPPKVAASIVDARGDVST